MYMFKIQTIKYFDTKHIEITVQTPLKCRM